MRCLVRQSDQTLVENKNLNVCIAIKTTCSRDGRMSRLNLDALLKVAPEGAYQLQVSLPLAIDPENEYEDKDPSENESSDSDEHMTEAAARQHYVDVGPSQMRRKARLTESDALEKPQYKGVKASRAEMFGDGSDDDDDGDDENYDDEESKLEPSDNGDQEDDDNDEDDDDDEDEEVTEDEDEDKDEDEDENLNEEMTEDEDRDEGEDEGVDQDHDDKTAIKARLDIKSDPSISRKKASTTVGSARAATTVALQEKESQTVLDQIREKRAHDARKGQHVRKQIRNWEKALRLRISFQKLVTGASRLPPPAMLEHFFQCAPTARDDIDKAAAELEDIAAQLLDIRMQLWKVNVPATSLELDKHVRVEASQSKALEDLEQVLQPYIHHLLTRWSNKIASAPDSRNAGASARLQLRAMNQGIVDQIEQALAGDGMDRLVNRTRVWRADDVQRLGVQVRKKKKRYVLTISTAMARRKRGGG